MRLGFFFSNWEKSHLNPIGKGAEFRPLRTPKKIPGHHRGTFQISSAHPD